MDPAALPLSRLFNAYMVWAEGHYPYTEEGKQQWDLFRNAITAVPPGAAAR